MPIKNYTTKIEASKTVGEIQQMLAQHGAKQIMLDYSYGKITCIYRLLTVFKVCVCQLNQTRFYTYYIIKNVNVIMIKRSV